LSFDAIILNRQKMKILGIETSCDETAAAIVEDGSRILSGVVASQVEIHARYGGIVPEVASRQHLTALLPTLRKAFDEAGLGLQDIDGIAVTSGPGLPGSLLTGLNFAKALAFSRSLPLAGVNHLEGHIYANWLEGGPPSLPAVCLIISGGHTELVLLQKEGEYTSLGRTRDDAIGEAYDKVARLLGLGYPGGPAIEKVVQGLSGRPKGPVLTRPWLPGSHDFSFSGLKTAVLRLSEEGKYPPAQIAAAFQDAAVEVLVDKTIRAADEVEAKEVLLAGGVACNTSLRRAFKERCHLPLRIPRPALCTDNAAMIACCGYYHFRRGDRADYSLDARPGLQLTGQRPHLP